MATGRLSGILQHFRTITRPEADTASDRELLERFLRQRDESAFESLLLRHAAMVWSVCCRILRDRHDAEDAFQTTFLVLAHKAASVRGPSAANWLYGVAQRTALEARRAAARRRAKEEQAVRPEVMVRDENNELREIIDQELARLPGRYREVVVLCDLEERTRQEVAGILGLPEGTISSRLARARSLLARLLARRGLACSGAGLAAVLSQNATAGCVPPVLVSETLEAATLVVAGQVGSISPQVATLTRGVMKVMVHDRMKGVLAVLLVVGMMSAAVGWFAIRLAKAAQADEKQATRVPEEKVGRLTDKEVRQEIALLKQQLQQALERATALDASLTAREPERKAFLYQGKPASFWVEEAKDLSVEYRLRTIPALLALSKVDGSVIPVLLETVWDMEEYQLRRARETVAARGREAIPYLLQVLKGRNPGPRLLTINILGDLGPEARSAVPVLIDLLKDRNAVYRADTATTLAAIAPDNPATVPALIGLLEDPSRLECYTAAMALGRIGPAAQAAVPALRLLLPDTKQRELKSGGQVNLDVSTMIQVDGRGRQVITHRVIPAVMAARALGKIGPDAAAALPDLRKAASRLPAKAVEEVEQAIERIMSKPAEKR
jgi:RNA polymerase sigma factor (sigma-70 family)